MKFIYKETCPNDLNDISSTRLEKGLVCESCLPEDRVLSIKTYEDQIIYLEKEGRLSGKLKEYYNLRKKLDDFESFSKKIFKELTSAQRSWFMKASRNESFAITYPTGLGKTTFGVLYSLYKLSKNMETKIFFIVPTRMLVQKISEILAEYAKKYGLEIKIIKSGDKKNNIINSLDNKNFNIAVLTPRFLINNKNILMRKNYTGLADLIFVDDVDALIKSSKSIDIVLNLLGFDDEIQTRLRVLTKRTSKEDENEKTRAIEEIALYKSTRKIGQLIFSSATTRYTSSRIRLLRYTLNFEPGSSLEIFRNVYEVFKFSSEKGLVRTAIKLIRELGKGGLIFVPIDKPQDLILKLRKRLKKYNINAEVVSSKTNARKILEKFEKGELDILIGYATFYGPLVRGIDLPSKIKYAIFLGVPKFKFSFKIFENNPLRTLWLAGLIVDYIEEFNLRRSILDISAKLRNEIQKYTPEALRALSHLSESRKGLRLFDLTKALYDKLSDALKNENLVKKLEEKRRLRMLIEAQEKYFLIPDSLTYIQASGRTSRLFYGGITTGLSIILVDDPVVFEGLKYQLSLRSELFKFHTFEEFRKEKEKVVNLINIERNAIEKRDEQVLKELRKLELKTALFIVESPTKAKTISSFFGRPVLRLVKGLRVYECLTDRYILYITATRGHLFDLAYTHDPNKGYFYGIAKENYGIYVPIYSTIKKCRNCKEQFTEYTKQKGICNFCGSNKVDDQTQTVEALQELAQECDLVIIATDPDSEGEKIAKDVFLAIRPFAKEIKRAEMHEITLRAFLNAMADLREVNDRLAIAQVVRRIGDRWVGFSLSSLMQHEFQRKSMGVGRVQTPVLNWIVKNYLRSDKNRRVILQAKFGEIRLRISTKAIKIKGWKSSTTRKLKKLLRNSKLVISKVSTKKKVIKPPVPLSTIDMLTIAIPKLKISSDAVMRIAQELFEAGLITYHRTDSRYISYAGFEIARKYLQEKNLSSLFVKKQYDKEGTHECIRPTRPLDRQELESAISTGQVRVPITLTPQHYLLYDIIFRSFVASQMTPARAEICILEFQPIDLELAENERKTIKLSPIKLLVSIDENSFVKIYPKQVFPSLKNIAQGQSLEIEDIRILKKGRRLFTEEEIIQMMKKEGIGRPSTYAIILSRLISHGYVFKSPNKKVFIPTRTGLDLIARLKKIHPWIIDTALTREFEETMDKIEKGEITEADVMKKLDEFFVRFYELKQPLPIELSA
ncbi:MAG TPA: reverse gyrase [Geobacterales bacterium]|nr:reverse gyrase [Geobacterales bacterium]